MSKKEIVYKIVIDDSGNVRKLEEMSKSAGNVTSAVRNLDSGFEALAARVSDAITSATSSAEALGKTSASAKDLYKAQQELVTIQESLASANSESTDALASLNSQYEELRLSIEKIKDSPEGGTELFAALENELAEVKNALDDAERSVASSSAAYDDFAGKATEALDKIQTAQQEKSSWTKKLTEEEIWLQKLSIEEFQKLVEQERATRHQQKEFVGEVSQELITRSSQRALAEKMSSEEIVTAIAAERVAIRAMKAEVEAGNTSRQEELQTSQLMLEALEKVNVEKYKFMTQQRSIEAALAVEIQQNGKNTEHYRELTTLLKEVGTQYREINRLRNIETKGASQLAGIISGMQGLVGAYTAANGVISLFVQNQEQLQKVQTRLQSTMAILMGMQQLANALHSTSAFRIATVTRVTNFLSVANTRLAAALGISTAAAQALMATLTLGLSVAITAVIAGITALVRRQREHSELMAMEAERQQEYARNIADNASKQMLAYKRLQTEWNSLKSDYEKNQWIKDNTAEFSKLGVSITSISEAELVLINSEQQFVATIRSRAVAAASMDLAAEKYKQAIEKMVLADSYQPSKDDLKAAGKAADKSVSRATKMGGFPFFGDAQAFRDNEFKLALDKIVTQRRQEFVTTAQALEKEGDAFINAASAQNQRIVEEFSRLGLQQASTGAGNEMVKAIEEYNKWLIQTSSNAADELVNIEFERQKRIIEAMEDGYEKQMAQIHLNEAQKLVEIQKYVKSYVDSAARLQINKGATADYGTFSRGADGQWSLAIAENALQLTPEVAAVVNEKLADLSNLVSTALDDIINKQIKDLGLSIDKAADLQAAEMDQMVDLLLANIDKELLAYTNGFNVLRQRASLVFADISELSKDFIREIISNAEDYVATNESLTSEGVAQYRQAIDKANEYLVDKNPWEALKVAQERYAKAVKDYTDSQGQTDPMKRIEAQNQALLDQASALNVIRKAYEEIGFIVREFSGFGLQVAEVLGVDSGIISGIEQMINGVITLATELATLSSKVNKLGTTTGQITGKVADAAGSASDALSGMGGAAVAAGATSVSAILAIVGAILQIAGAISQVEEAVRKKKLDKYLKSVTEQLAGLKAQLDNIAQVYGVGDSWFTTDSYQNIIAINKQLNAVIYNLKDIAAQYNAAHDAAEDYSLTNWFKKYSEAYEDLRNYVAEIIGIMDFPRFLEFFDPMLINNIDLERLKEIRAELEGISFAGSQKDMSAFEGFKDSIVEQIDLLLSTYEELKDAVRDMVGDVSGAILSTVNSMWKEIRSGGEMTFEALATAAKKNVAEVIEEMVSQQIWATIMGDYFDSLGENLSKAILQGGDILSVFEIFWEGMEQGLHDYTAAYEEFLRSAAARGWDMSSGAVGPAGPGSIKAMREELAKLNEEWNLLTAEERESAIGEQLFQDIQALEELIRTAEDYYSVSSDASREAFDAWSESLDDALENAANKYEQIGAYLTAYLAALYDVTMSEEDRAEAIERSYKAAEKLAEQITAELTDKYMTGEQRRELDLSTFRDDLEWANMQGLPELAENIQKAWDAYLLSEWEQGFRDLKSSAQDSIHYLELLNEQKNNLASSGLEGAALEGAGVIIDEEIAATESEILTKLLEKFKSVEQQRLDLIQEYTNYEAFLRERGYEQQADAAAEELRNQLSDLDEAAIEASDLWEELTQGTEALSEEAILSMVAQIRGMIDDAEDLTDEARARLLAKLDKVEEDLKAKKWDAAISAIDDIQSILRSLNETLQQTGIISAESASDLNGIIVALGNIGAIAAGLLAKDYVAVISGSIGLLGSLFQLLDFNGRKIDRQQKLINSNLKELKNLYSELDHIISRSIATETYAKQLELIDNLRQQQEALQQMISSESGRKDPDDELIAAYQQEIQQLQYNIERVYEAMSSDLLQTNVKALASSISDILSDMTQTTEDKLLSVKKTAQDVVRDMLRNWLQLRYLEAPLQAALKAMEEEMLTSGPTQEMAERFYAEAERIAQEYNDAFGSFASLFPSLTSISDNQIASAWRSMSEEAGNAAVGQLTRIALNGVQGLELQREQIEGINQINQSIADMAVDIKLIAVNTATLHSIERILKRNNSIGL